MKIKVKFNGYGPPSSGDPAGFSYFENPIPTLIDAVYDTESNELILSEDTIIRSAPEGDELGSWRRADGIPTNIVDQIKQEFANLVNDPDIGQYVDVVRKILKRSDRKDLLSSLFNTVSDTGKSISIRKEALDKILILLLDATDD
jgi:hypothetical protein